MSINALQANVCPLGIEHGASGECEGFIANLPNNYKQAPGHRHTHLAGSYHLKPFQYQYNPNLPCKDGFVPLDAGFVNSCRPVNNTPVRQFYKQTLPSQRYPFTDGLYSYTY